MSNPSDPDDCQLLQCPHCQKIQGEATSVVLGHGVRTTHYRCRACSHEWQQTIPMPDRDWMFLRPEKKK
jgi:hypothetical protein